MALNNQQFDIVFDMKLTSEKFSKQLNKTNQRLGSFNKTEKNTKTATDKVNKSAKELTMSFLGLMFFGMSLQRVFSSIAGPAMEAFGVMDLMQSTLLVLFLPTMEKLMPLLLDMSNWFMNLPDGTKRAIGTIAMIVGGLGTLFAMTGITVLGLRGVHGALQAISAVKTMTVGITGATAAPNIVSKISDALKGPMGNMFIGVAGTALIIGGILALKDAKGDLLSPKAIQGALMEGLGATMVLSRFIGGLPAIQIGVLLTLLPLAVGFGKKMGEYFTKPATMQYEDVSGIDYAFQQLGFNPVSQWGKGNISAYSGRKSTENSASNVNITNNFNGFTNDDLNRSLENRDRDLVESIRRQSNT